MSDQNPSEPTPQFGTAEYVEQPGGEQCRTCEQPISDSFYRINGAMTCTTCAEKAVGRLPKDSHKAFVRAILFGVGAAFLGLVLYSVVGIVTGLAIGYVSLAVGYIVGKAMMMGSWGIGGRRYQVAAAAFTYAAVSLSAIPIGITMMIKERLASEASKAKSVSVKQETKVAASDPNAATKEPQQPHEQDQQASLGTVLAWLTVIGLISPFLELSDPFHGIIGLIILLVGIHIAWKTTAGASIEILGPFNA
jgi:hypothetical protein